MKKTLTALAVLGAFAGSAMAADVTLYGKVDAGLNYNKVSADLNGAEYVDEDTFAMKSGQNSGSRFGLKGTEDLGNGMTVGFQLENGFSVDDGKLGQGDRLFGRQATLFVNGGFGEVAFGRVGGLASGLGSYSKIYNYSAFGTGWDNAATSTYFGLARDRYDNTVTYVSPEFAGAKVYAQYSFQTAGAEDSDSGANERYAALGATYDLGAFSASLVVDSVMPSNKDVEVDDFVQTTNKENSLGVSLGASYDFGFMKLMAMGQYGKNESKFMDTGIGDIEAVTGLNKIFANYTDKVGELGAENHTTGFEGFDVYSLRLSATAPVASGTLYAQVSYAKADEANKIAGSNFVGETEYTVTDGTYEADAWGLAVAYQYPLSTRTYVYGFASYNKLDQETNATVKNGETLAKGNPGHFELETDITTVGFGMVHNF